MRSPNLAILSMACFFVSSSAIAQAPDSLSFQGLLTNTEGVVVSDGPYNLLIKMYKGSSKVWEQNHVGVPVNAGIFNIVLSGTPTYPLDTVAFNAPIDLGVTVNGGLEMTPRTPLTSAAYARAMPGMYAFYREDGANNRGYNVVGGGENNVVGPDAVGATIGGGGGTLGGLGFPNQVIGDFATVGGGYGNVVNGFNATIGGGNGNMANGSRATVGGGDRNTANGSRATVGGGDRNTATGLQATVGGGDRNTATGLQATVGGGERNEASNNDATVGGGQGNIANGARATVPGGDHNRAEGSRSFAAGRNAKAIHDGAFVWNTTFDSLVSTGPNQFLIRADGGVGIGTNQPLSNSQLHVEHGAVGTNDWGVVVTNSTISTFRAGMRISDTGFFEITNNADDSGPNFAQLNSTGNWTALSDRRLKTDIEPASGLLQAALELEPVRYYFKNLGDQDEKSLGVIGQQVQEVVPSLVTEGDLVTVNYAGLSVVAIGAIQGLYEMVKGQAARIDELERRLAEE